MAGIYYNNQKYIKLSHSHHLKFISLGNNIYFTLLDIIQNTNCKILANELKQYNFRLTNNISYEDRNDTFQYSDDISNKPFLKSVYRCISVIHKTYDFNFFLELDEGIEIIHDEPYITCDNINYINYDIWWEHLQNFKNLIDNMNVVPMS